MKKHFWDCYAPYRTTLLFVVAGSLVSAGLDLAFPMAIRHIMNELLPSGFTRELAGAAGILLALYALSYILNYKVEYIGHTMGAKIEYDMRQKLFGHIMRLGFSYYDNSHSGKLMSRVVSDISEVGHLMFAIPRLAVVSVVTITGATGMLFYLNWRLAAVVSVMMVLKIYEAADVNRRMKALFLDARVKTGELSGQLSESLQGIRLVRIFGNEAMELEKMNEAAERLLGVQKESFSLAGRMHSGIAFFSNVTNLIITVVGGGMISLGMMEMSDLVAFLLYMMAFMHPVFQLIMLTEVYQRGMAGFTRYLEVMNIPEDDGDEGRQTELTHPLGSIEFSHVDFSYSDSVPVFSDFSLSVAAGESVGIVGASGGGKTTLCELLMGLYDIGGGSISIDGKDIRTLRTSDLRREIGMIQQDIFLFSATVRENIAYGRPDATDEEIAEAARLADADGFIEELPEGYDTFVGERGVKLSGGQKQRIAIARMFLRNPSILILDEATSALDNETERQVQRAMQRLAQNRTTIMVAHRLRTVQAADRILVLDHGDIAEEGTHESLMERQGIYYSLYAEAG